MKSFEELSPVEKSRLLKFPVYISMLAANNDDSLNPSEKKAALKFCHIKTFTCDTLLKDFYRRAEKECEMNVAELERTLPKEKSGREEIIKNELASIENILLELGTDYALLMYRSMKAFKKHVSRAHRNILEYFVFPLPIKGLTD